MGSLLHADAFPSIPVLESLQVRRDVDDWESGGRDRYAVHTALPAVRNGVGRDYRNFPPSRHHVCGRLRAGPRTRPSPTSVRCAGSDVSLELMATNTHRHRPSEFSVDSLHSMGARVADGVVPEQAMVSGLAGWIALRAEPDGRKLRIRLQHYAGRTPGDHAYDLRPES